jgi:imidazolonepropionase-like amidohydrolase
MVALFVSLALLTPSFPAFAPAQAREPSYAVRAKHVRLHGNAVLHDAVLAVEEGRIAFVGEAAQAGSRAGEAFEHDGWLSAGLVACRAASGTRGETPEWKRAMAPDTRFADVVDFAHPDFQRAAAAGITTMEVVPAPFNVVNGLTAVVKTHGGAVLDRDAHLFLSFGSDALRNNRAPTSYPGAIAELQRRFERPEGVWRQVAGGDLPVLLEATERDEVLRALAFAAEHELSGALSRANLALELAPDIKRSGLAVIVGPFPIGTHPRELETVAALGRERVPIAFAADTPITSDQGLRLSAAMCVRAGLDPATAWDALTSTAAQIAGVGSTVGRLAKGYQADFVLWSGDPLDLSSRPVAVYVDGRLAWGGSQE